jgi:aryl-alcohol dehydrogenase-like predicted oxidoreductase
MALRFILMNDDVSTTIPGMRKERNVSANTSVSDGKKLNLDLYNELKKHRWDREPTSWSQ